MSQVTLASGEAIENHGWRNTFAGLGINLALGILYTWSVISKGIPEEWEWTQSDKSMPYAIACLVFSLVMVPAGRMQDKMGPRIVATLGGILVRQYLQTNSIDELGRVVMLGPPNQGSAAADELEYVPGFDWINGPAGKQLGKGEDSVPLALGPVDFELGVIAGNRTIDPVTSAVLENPDDGRVSVEDTKVEGMDDFVVVEHSHAFMMRMRRPIELTKRFLRSGSFAESVVVE